MALIQELSERLNDVFGDIAMLALRDSTLVRTIFV